MTSDLRVMACGFALALGCASSGVPKPTAESKAALAKVQVRQIMTACEQYRIDTGAPPSNLNQLVPKYLELIANDPWGRAFSLQGQCVIVSSGPDGVPGTTDDISSAGEQKTDYTK